MSIGFKHQTCNLTLYVYNVMSKMGINCIYPEIIKLSKCHGILGHPNKFKKTNCTTFIKFKCNRFKLIDKTD